VFDKDSFTADHFNRALQLATREGINVAYSNEAFELWYVLHFEYLDAAISRNGYIKKLKERFGEYNKNDKNMYSKCYAFQSDAIRNAKRLLAEHTSSNPAFMHPSTTVHLLVEELNQLVG